MWALRRASTNSVRAQGLNVAAFRACAGLGPVKEDKSSSSKNATLHSCLRCHCTTTTCGCPCHGVVQVPNRFCVGYRSLSSQAGAKSGGEEENELDEGFSDLGSPETSETTGGGDVVVDDDDDTSSSSESDVSGDEENVEDDLETELGKETEGEASKGVSDKRGPPSNFFRLIMNEQGPSISKALEKYVADGPEISRSEIYNTLLRLRRVKAFKKALQLSEWMETNKEIEFAERDYASRVDLIAKVHGLQKAETYIKQIPSSYRTELVYRTFLANCVLATNVEKAEEVFNNMRDLGFPVTAFSCNQLLLLYKRIDKKKIADVLLLMEKKDLKPTMFTYQVLIDSKGHVNDMAGMDQIVEAMKAEGLEPNIRVKASLARHYAAAGRKEKAEAVLKEMEESDLKVNPWICSIVLPIYADLGKADDVERVWKVCESKFRATDCLAAIEAWGKLKNVEKAEAIFNELSKTKKRLPSNYYSVMLKVYADNKKLDKGKDLLKQMGDKGCYIGPVAWDALVKLYVDAGEVDKAYAVLQKAMQHNSLKPMFSSFMAILDHYAKKGDVHNAEKIFYKMRQAGYVARLRPFHALLNAYLKAKVPAYGIRERMKADNIFPNKALAEQLSQVDAFKNNAVSDLLD